MLNDVTRLILIDLLFYSS